MQEGLRGAWPGSLGAASRVAWGPGGDEELRGGCRPTGGDCAVFLPLLVYPTSSTAFCSVLGLTGLLSQQVPHLALSTSETGEGCSHFKDAETETVIEKNNHATPAGRRGEWLRIEITGVGLTTAEQRQSHSCPLVSQEAASGTTPRERGEDPASVSAGR